MTVGDIFRVDPQRVGKLDPYAAVDLAARLIRADASASGISAAIVDIPSAITAPDGGVDGTATGSPSQSIHGLVKKGATAYQFRTGAFAPGSIADILLTRQGEVKPRIRSCIEGGGTLVVLLFGWDGTARTDDEAMAERFRKALAAKSSALAGASVDVWALNRIVAAIEQFPGLAAGVNGTISNDALAMSHHEWSCILDMTPTFRHGAGEDDTLKRIRDRLRGDRAMPIHVRVSGPPGSGKTRLVLEATRADDLAPRVVYTANPLVAEPIIAARARSAGGAGVGRLILVVDECDLFYQSDLWLRLQGDKEGGDTDLVTIYNEPGVDTETTPQVKVPGMGDEQIAEIIEDYAEGRVENISGWVERCSPSPRAAHIVGRNLSAHPNNMHRNPDTAMVWERYIAGRGELGGGEYKDRLAVLLWLGQFTKFGFDAPHECDGARIAKLVHKHHPEISAHRFREVVRTLRSMRVLQGGPILYITPRILHEYLWIKWWEHYGPADVPSLPPGGEDDEGDAAGGRGAAGHLPTLHSRHRSMLESMRRKKDAARAVGALFGKGGPFEDDAASGDGISSDLFEAASKVSPVAAIGYAEAAVAAMRRRDRQDIPALQWDAAEAAGRRMLGAQETFVRAARLLLSIADVDARGGGGDAAWRAAAANACDTFCDAMDPAPQMGLPGISLAARLEVLAGAVRAGAGTGADARDDERARRVALRACGAVLAMRQFSPAVPHRRGVGDNAAYWRPADRAGLAAYLRGVLELAAEAGRDTGNSAAVRKEAAGAVLGSLAQTALLPEIAERSVDAAERMRADGLVDGEALLAVAERIVMHDSHRIDPAAMRRISAIIDRGAAGGGLHGRLVWRIGLDGYKCRSKFGTVVNNEEDIGRLAGELARDADALDAELDWLVGEGAAGPCAASLGRELAALDDGGGGDGGDGGVGDGMAPPPLLLLDRIENATRREGLKGGGGHLLAGYLAEMCGRRPRAAEDAMGRILDDPVLRGMLPTTVLMSDRVSDGFARRLAQAVVDGGLERGALAHMARGRSLAGVSEETFRIMADALTAGREARDAAPAADGGRDGGRGTGSGHDYGNMAGPAMLGLVHARYVARRDGGNAGGRPGRMPAETVAGMLLHEDVLDGRPGIGIRHIDVEMWVGAALALARQEGDDKGTVSRLAGAAICRLGVHGMFGTEAAAEAAAPFLDEVARSHPRTVWRIAASFMGPPLDARACRVRAWLSGRAGGRTAHEGNGAPRGIAAVPARVILEWAAEDPGTRPRRVADLLSPPHLDAARDLVARFGGLEGVAEGVERAFVSWRVWGAPESDMSDTLARLGSMRRGEDDPRAAAWLDGRIADLAARVGGARGGGADPLRAAPLLSG